MDISRTYSKRLPVYVVLLGSFHIQISEGSGLQKLAHALHRCTWHQEPIPGVCHYSRNDTFRITCLLVWMHNLNWNYDDNSVLANTMYCDGTLLAFPNVHTYVCIHLATWLPHVQLYIVNLQMMPSVLVYDTWTTTNNHFSTSYTLTFTACET